MPDEDPEEKEVVITFDPDELAQAESEGWEKIANSEPQEEKHDD